MRLETDIKRIEQRAEQQAERNWAFRCFLKGSDLPAKEIDSVVHALNHEISSQIDCARCANCCKAVQPLLKPCDVQRLARYLNLSATDFRTQYLQKDDEEQDEVFKVMPCPFLQENRCTVYLFRPDDCRSYPHLHKRDFVFRVSQAVSNYSVCPIVFNVFEMLKQELWHRGSRPKGRRGRPVI